MKVIFLAPQYLKNQKKIKILNACDFQSIFMSSWTYLCITLQRSHTTNIYSVFFLFQKFYFIRKMFEFKFLTRKLYKRPLNREFLDFVFIRIKIIGSSIKKIKLKLMILHYYDLFIFIFYILNENCNEYTILCSIQLFVLYHIPDTSPTRIFNLDFLMKKSSKYQYIRL